MDIQNKDLLQSGGFINGQWVKGAAQFDVSNPATDEVVAQVADLGAEETQAAIDAAQASFKPWSKLKAKERQDILMRWHDLIMANKDDLAHIMTVEMGKPLKEAAGEIAYGASFIEWFAEEGKRAYGDVIPHTADNTRIVVTKEPIGVCAAITPWNFPSAMITRKVAPALAAGCPVVIKPAAETPLSALALAVLAKEAGIPDGVLNIVTGKKSSEIGKVMCESNIVRKLSFTGSTKVGKILMGQCADTIKKVSLELGGNAPFIVFDDADLDAAVAGAIACKYRNAGQTCVCANRIYVQSGIYDAFAKKFAEHVGELKVGNGLDEDVYVGPMVNEGAMEKVKEHIADAVEKGGDVLVGGAEHELGHSFFQPTVVTGVTKEMKVAREETFGPMAPLFRFDSEEDVIAQANDTNYGLAAYFYANDLGRVWRVAEALEYGMVGVNSPILSSPAAPFGGIKESGIGREGSKYGLDDFMEVKYILMGGL